MPSVDPAHPPHATTPRTVPDGASLDHPALYFNRELGEIDFNWRVLAQALDDRTPLLERVRFLAITASNIDEFVQKRVGGLKRQQVAGVSALSPDGRTPGEQLDLIRIALRDLYAAMTSLWHDTLCPALRDRADIDVCTYDALSKDQQAHVDRYFHDSLYPILTPLAVDPGRPFPFISNLSLSLAVTLREPEGDTEQFARIKVPASRGRWFSVGGDNQLIAIEDIIAHHVDKLFPGMEVLGVYPFRVTRNANIARDEEEADDLIAMISEELRERRFAQVVRLELPSAMPESVRSYLCHKLALSDADLYEVESPLALTDLADLADYPRPGLTYEPWQPVIPKRLAPDRDTTADIFAVLRQSDLLVHHPYELFSATVLRLLEEAAEDPHVLAIKQTLYRTSDDSPTVAALVRAAELGKQVAVLVEVKARFDEANNIEWGKKLEDAGVHVAYGIVGLKTHAKATLIVREETQGIRTYCHIGTGNYHVETARLYTDLGLLTASPDIGEDVTNLFHYLTGYAPEQRYHRLLVAPRHMRGTLYELIDAEIATQQRGGEGRIIAKMNGLDDVGIIQKLYEASQAGVRIDLIVRGLSRLRPQLPGYSDNIRLLSIVGRFLEHDRVVYFGNDGDPRLFLGSADWRHRNLSDRVEALTPVTAPDLKERLIGILDAALRDNRLAWDLSADGQYRQRHPGDDDPRGLHQVLMHRARDTTA
ncbi:MAG: polyphosphate kinase 1 [Trueperaceae bacterium]|nr:polyphosphate kinase 1 [Trueperaceae bacterium]